MGIIKTARLIYEYIRRDEEEKIDEAVEKAIDDEEKEESTIDQI